MRIVPSITARGRLAGRSEVIRDPSFDAAAKSKAYTNIGELRTQACALKEAIRNFSQALSFDSDNSSAYAGRAEARAAFGDMAAAIRDYDKAIAISPSDSANLQQLDAIIAYINSLAPRR